MEVGDDKIKKNPGTHQSTNLISQNSNVNSQVFDVVIDPLTDFQKVSELSHLPTSPQRSYNLTSPASSNDLCERPPKELRKSEHSHCKSESSLAEECEVPPHSSDTSHSDHIFLYNITDSHLKSSDVTVANCSGSGFGKSSLNSSGGGSSSNHHRLVVAEVHRFGYRPLCAGSPHDLASCPAATAASAPYETYQSHKYALGKSTEFFNRCDALKTLNQASSALALTETLIGPLRISPVPQEVLNEVVCNMENKTKVPVSVNNGTSEDFDSLTIGEEVDTRCSSFTISPTSMGSVKNPLCTVTFDVRDKNQGSGRVVGSLPSILHPGVHHLTSKAACTISSSSEKMNNAQAVSKSVKDLSLNTEGMVKQECMKTVPEIHKTVSPLSREVGGKSRVITVPVGMSDHGPVEVYREVHQYPASSITTVVEKCSYIGQMQPNARPPAEASKRRKNTHKLKKQESNHLGSKSSIASASSTCTSVASGSTLVSQSSSELTPMTQSQASSSKTSLNDTRSDSAGPISKPVLSAAIMQMRQALESVSNASDNHSDKSSGGIEVASNFSDTSSNLSTLSDLSGYEDEYIKIKRLVSDAVIPPEDYKKIISKMNNKPPSKPVPSFDHEKVIRDLQAQKEDLEIQLHRLSIQVQNAVREKELYQQQLELMQTKVTETNQKQYFEVLKQRANLEGQLEMLKQELENTVYEKNQLQSKFTDFVKEFEESKSSAVSAKEAESQIKARLSKYEETNKELEEKIKETEEKFERISKDYEKAQREIKDIIGKNEYLELSLAELRDSETQLMEEIKGLRSHTSQLQTECHTRFEAQAEAESAANKASSELQTLQTSSVWYQEQLQIAQAARSSLQQELLESRSVQARVTSEKEALETKVQTLIHEAEDGQARAVREKASLVAHLEALQADMAEREAVLSQLERDRGSETKLMEDRRQRLEQDRHRIHKLRLELSDTERQLDFYRDDVKHKCALLAKYENELKDLKTVVAVNQEVLRERDIRIQNLEQTIEEIRLSVKGHQEERKVKDSVINSLKEEKLKLEVSLAAANSEKKEVDDAIMKVREDMTKLSSNFYRMKHDLAAKDRQIEVLMREAKDDMQIKLSLEKKVEALEKRVREDDEKKELIQEVERLQLSLRKVSAAKEKFEEELTEIRRTSKTLEIEKKGLNEAVHLREEQIQNMQCSLESYREAILKKDEEIYVAHEQTSTVEKTYMELRRNWETLKEENLALRHDAEAYTEHEKVQKREKSDLKDSIQKERKLKQNLERKIDCLVQTHEEDKLRILKEKENLDELVNELTQKLQGLKDEKTKTHEDKVCSEKKYSESCKEIQVVKEERDRLESRVKEAVAEADNYKTDLSSKCEVVKSLEVKVSCFSRENCDMKEKLTSLHNEREKQVMELEALLKVRTDEMTKLQKNHNDTESLLTELTQEKNMLSSHINTLLAENSHLKKTAISHEALVKESKTLCETSNTNTKKSAKNTESLHKEIGVLHKKLSEYENKMKEAVKQKENIQSTIRNTKKENMLMRAKLKELDVLKKRCKEFESGKDSKELESFKIKFKELESKLDAKHNELSSLTVSLNEKTSHIQILKEREQELCAQARTLHADKREMQEKVLSLEGIHQRVHQEISDYQQQLKIAENERDEWMAKYESLRDFIPERDTSTQPAVQLGPSSHQSFSNGEESAVVSGTSDSTGSLGGKSVNSLCYLNEDTQTSVTNGTQFDKTMADLQAQVSLTSEALQSKEQQIHDLQEKLRSLMQERTEIGTNPKASESCPCEEVVDSMHRIQIDGHLERREQLKIPSSICHECKMQKEMHPRGDHSEIQSLLDKIKRLESDFNGKEVELQETQMRMTVAANEFREKQRRYESNVRLLTRKLKEHMKGRKSAEKEMQAQAEDHQRLLNEEQQRYAVLRCRCMELEGLRETLDGQVTGLESEVEEVRGALGRARQEAYDHHNNTLQLQKEIGRLRELCKTADNLRLEAANLKESIRQRENQLKELEKELKVNQEELRQAQESSASLTSTVQQMKSQKEHIQHEYDAALLSLRLLRQELEAKQEECSRVQQSVSQLQSVNADLRKSLNDANVKGEQLTSSMKRLREEKQIVIEEHQTIGVQLQESSARNAALENHIKVIEGEVKVGKEEVNQVKEQLIAKDSSHQIKVAQLEQSVTRARQEVVALTSQLDQVQQERVSYQTQATELRTALHSTLRQLKAYKAEEEARAAEASTIKSEVGIIPSPSPLDLTALSELMERSARPLRPTLPLTNLESCLSSLKAEVNMLQTQLQSKTEELTEGLNHEAVAVLEEKLPIPETTESCTRNADTLDMEGNQ